MSQPLPHRQTASPNAAGRGVTAPLLSATVAVVSGLAVVFLLAGQTGRTLVVLLGGLLLAMLLLYFSFRSIHLPVILWIISILGFRQFLMLGTPGLPDLSPERVFFAWTVTVIVLKSAVRRRDVGHLSLLDWIVLSHTLYLLAACLIMNASAFNSWTKSYLLATTAYFFGKAYFHEPKWIVRLFALLVCMNMYHAVTSIAEHFKWYALIWPKQILDTTIGFVDPGRSRGLFLQPAVLGVIMAMVLPFQFYFLMRRRSLLWRGMVLGSMGLVLLGVFFTYTRSTWLATAAGLIALAAIGWRRYSVPVLQLIGVALIILLAGVVSLKSDRFYQKRINSEHTITGRINTLATAYRMFRDNPIFGVGFMNYSQERQNYREPIRVPFYGLIKSQADKDATPHDIYLGSIAEEGLFGMSMQFAIYALIAAALARQLRRGDREDPYTNQILPCIAGAMVAYLVGGMGFDYRYFETLNSVFYLLAGALVGQRSEPEPTATEVSGPVAVRPRRSGPGLAPSWRRS